MSDANFTPPGPQPRAGLPDADVSTMSTPETLSNIFFDPAATFESLRARPRFLAAAVILVAMSMLVTVLLFQKVSFEHVVREAIEKNPRTEQMSPEERERIVQMQTGTLGKALAYGSPIIGTAAILAAGAAIYLLGVSLMGGKMSYRQALSVWAYSSLPPAVLATILAVVLLFLKSPEDLDFTRPGAGLLVTNLGILIGPSGSAVLRAALSWFDLFTFYGMFLAALGLRKVGRISSGSAWTIVIALWVLGMLFSLGRAALFGG